MTFSSLRRVLTRAVLASLFFLPLKAETYGLSERPNVGPYFDNIFPEVPPAIPTNWSAVVAFPNLSFNNPLGMIPLPGTNKLVVWEREGKVWCFENTPTVSVKTLMLDLSTQCQGWDDSGLLGLTFHPDFATNRQMFVFYDWRGGIANGVGDLGPIIGSPTVRPPTVTEVRTRLSRFVLDAANRTTLASEYTLIDQKKYTVWHNGGGMFFHPDNGFLYITTGADPASLSQQIDIGFFSAILRIDVDKRGGSTSHAPLRRAYNEVAPDWPRYYVPNDNPFVGVPDALEEMYSIGLRSPHRMSYDAVTGRIFIGDVGESTWEEIDVVEPADPAGLNFQWDKLEGSGTDIPDLQLGVNKQPLYSYLHGDDGTCVIGGYVYRGQEFPELTGKYIFGDNITSKVWYLDESTTPVSKVLLTTVPKGPGPNSGGDYSGISSFGVDANGEIYICQLSSTAAKIYKLQRGGAAPTTPLPSTLSATGLFSDMAALTPSPRLLPYEINVPFWSDHAIKSRFAAIPSESTIGFQSTGDWTFPAGSIFVKHFEMAMSDVDPSQRKRLETRVIVKKDDGTVYGATYKWRADNSDADLLDSSLTETLPISTGEVGQFSSVDIGLPLLTGSTTRDGNLVTLTGAGADIFAYPDQFQYAYQSRTGDFDISVRVKSVSNTHMATKAGLMVRESLTPGSAYVMAMVYPGNATRTNYYGGYGLQYRESASVGAGEITPTNQPLVSYPDGWLRLKREGDTFISYSSQDGIAWSEYARRTVVMPSTLYFGPALTSHLATSLATATFEFDVRHQSWYYPSRQDCLSCHNPQTSGVLGISTRQLNRDRTFENGVVANQLKSWNHVGLFSDGPTDASVASLEKLYAADDTSVPLLTRARSYLDANCANCHRPGGVQALWDARFQTPFESQGIAYGAVSNNLGNDDGRVVVPQSLLNSILYHRVSVVGTNQMPPIGRKLVDANGVAMLAEWIQAMQPELLPKMQILGNETVIPNDDFSPSINDFTDFGAAIPGSDQVVRTYVIQNNGNGALVFNGPPVLEGMDAASFNIVQAPPETISAGSSGTFQIAFSPLTNGTKTAFVNIRSNDSNDTSTVFAIRGTATAQKLLAWWKLDETTGKTATDSSGNGREGTLTAPDPAWVTSGRSEGALQFTGAVNQSVTVQNNAALNPTAAITVTAWVRAIDWNGNRRIVQKGDTDSQYRLLAENGRLVWEIAGAGRVDTVLPATDTWFHVAGTYEGRTLRLYMNGALTVSKAQTGVIRATTNPLYLGTKTPAAVAGDHFNGDIDEVRIYANALPSSDVAALALQAGAVSIEATDATAQKGTADTGTFVITRNGRTTAALPVTLSLVTGEGQAVQNEDYTFSPALSSLVIPAGQTSVTLVATPINRAEATGPLNITASVVEGTNYSIGTQASARIQLLDSPINQWKVTAFGSLANAQAPEADDNADADGDGLSTLLEAVLGGDPLVNNRNLLPETALETINGKLYLTSTFARVTPPITGVTLLSRTSTSLTTSSWLPTVMVDGYPIANSNGTETMKFRSATPVSDNPKQFIRLEASKP